MKEHLSAGLLNLFVDGELSGEQSAAVNAHVAECPVCTSLALSQMMLKSTAAKAGQRYSMPAGLQARVMQEGVVAARREPGKIPMAGQGWGARGVGWATAAALALVMGGGLLVQKSELTAQRSEERTAMAGVESASLGTEAIDQHVATLASAQPLQVISTDRHTVKPWFQGRIPFSFNLPEGLAADTVLDGANLTYLHEQPVAQLLYHVGKHRVSVFLEQRKDSGIGKELNVERAGFRVRSFASGDLVGVAVSDVEPARLEGLVKQIEAAQTGGQ